MSHFTVVVFGDKVAEALEPFNEENINYEMVPVKDLLAEHLLQAGEEVTDEAAMKFIKNYVKANREPVAIVEEEWLKGDMQELYREELSRTGYYTYMTFDKEGVLNLVHRRDYSKCKWDWFQIGGRWSGMLIPKNGTYSVMRVNWYGDDEKYVGTGAFKDKDIHEGGQNRLRKKDIDFQAMIDAHLKERLEFFDANHSRKEFHTDIHGFIDNHIRKLRAEGHSIDETVPLYNHPDPKVAKTYREGVVMKYWAQPSTQSPIKEYFWSYDAVDRFFKMTREEFIEEETAKAFLPYAFIIDGQWHERGQMGMFGVGINEEDYITFAKRFKQALDSVHDMTHITVVDCHT